MQSIKRVGGLIRGLLFRNLHTGWNLTEIYHFPGKKIVQKCSLRDLLVQNRMMFFYLYVLCMCFLIVVYCFYVVLSFVSFSYSICSYCFSDCLLCYLLFPMFCNFPVFCDIWVFMLYSCKLYSLCLIISYFLTPLIRCPLIRLPILTKDANKIHEPNAPCMEYLPTVNPINITHSYS